MKRTGRIWHKPILVFFGEWGILGYADWQTMCTEYGSRCFRFHVLERCSRFHTTNSIIAYLLRRYMGGENGVLLYTLIRGGCWTVVSTYLPTL